jgi:hypothetical protein
MSTLTGYYVNAKTGKLTTDGKNAKERQTTSERRNSGQYFLPGSTCSTQADLQAKHKHVILTFSRQCDTATIAKKFHRACFQLKMFTFKSTLYPLRAMHRLLSFDF